MLNLNKFFRAIFQTVTLFIFTILVLLIISGALFFYFIIKNLPSVETLRDYRPPNGTEVFSSDGKKIAEFSRERRYRVEFSDLPKHVINAFIAAEDSRFYEHKGIDPSGILRAMLSNLIKGRYAQGGSTITQQVARSIVLGTRQKNIIRKIKEILLAWKLEKELSKNEILLLYLNEIYLGHGAFGIGAAAKNYFNKTVQELSLAEAALIAGLPQRPNDWDPFRNPLIAKRRQEYVLKRMEEESFITPEEKKEAWEKPVKLYLLENYNALMAPYFTEHIRVNLMNKFGAETILTSGYKVFTTLNYKYQKEAERAIEIGLREIDKRLGYRGVTLHLESDLEIFAMLSKIHDEIMNKVSQIRILEPLISPNDYKLSYDLESISSKRSPYFGLTPLKEGEYYKAVVVGVDDKNVYIKIGQTNALLNSSGTSWISNNGKIVLKDLFLKGDVIEVKVDKIDRLSKTVFVSLEQRPEIQGALLSVEVESGKVLAMVGGKDFEESKFNCATQAKRQVGSTYKPIIYAAAIDKGYSPSSLVNDSPIVFKFEGDLDADVDQSWKPRNYGEKFKGEIPLRTALIRSMNVPTVKILNQISIDYVIDYTKRFGITSPLQRDLSIALGSWSSSLEELLRAYIVFPRQGRPVKFKYIEKILDKDGKAIEIFDNDNLTENITQTSDSIPRGHIISPQTAFVITDMLRGVVREGTGWRAKAISRDVAGKTGTSNDHRDAWFIGFIPQLITGVWVGYEKDKPLHSNETGGQAAAPIWVEYMKEIVDDFPYTQFQAPDKVVFAYVDRNTGKLAGVSTTERVRVAFKEGSVPDKDGSNVLYIGEPTQNNLKTTNVGESNTEEITEPETDDSIRELY